MSSFGGSRQRVLYLLGGAYLGPGLQRNTGQFDVYEIDAKRWREVCMSISCFTIQNFRVYDKL